MWLTGTVLATALCCTAALFLPGCDDPRPAAPAVLLVTFDTTRADHLGCYGDDGAATPNLDALARRGLRCEQAYSPTPLTLPAHTSLLTGTWPLSHGVRDNTLFTVAPGARTLAEALTERGWRSAAAVGAFVLDAHYGLDQGFERYSGPPDAAPGVATSAERPAGAVTDDALAWLAQVSPTEPFFLWVHYFDPHHPYRAPESPADPFSSGYDAEISYADGEFGRLLDALQTMGRLDQTLVVATADHGESLGEHGEQRHGFFVYDAAVSVPLILAGPRVPAGELARPVSLIDVAPTILEWCGVPRAALPAATAPSLLASAADRPLYFETFLPFYAHRWAPLQALLWRGHKFIQSTRPELYDLGLDPGESHNLYAEDPDLAKELSARLGQLIREHPPLDNALVDSLRSLDLMALEALGYTAGQPGGALFVADLPDAKDGIADIVKEGTALFDLRLGRQLIGLPEGPGLSQGDGASASPTQGAGSDQGLARLERARSTYAELLERYPERVDLLAQLALAELSLGQTDAAVQHSERVVVEQPRNAEHHLALAFAYQALGRKEWARAEMVKAVALDRRSSAAYDWLAAYHESSSAFGRAAFWRAEEQRFLVGDDARRRAAGDERLRLQALARSASQKISGPDDYPRPELAPEGLR